MQTRPLFIRSLQVRDVASTTALGRVGNGSVVVRSYAYKHTETHCELTSAPVCFVVVIVVAVEDKTGGVARAEAVMRAARCTFAHSVVVITSLHVAFFITLLIDQQVIRTSRSAHVLCETYAKSIVPTALFHIAGLVTDVIKQQFVRALWSAGGLHISYA